MTINEDILVAYALGMLSPAEVREVEQHLEAQPEEAATVLGYLDALSEMVMELPPLPLSEGAEEILLTGIREESSKSSAWRWGLGLGMAAKAGAALWLLGRASPYEVRKQLDDYGSRPGAFEAPLVNVNGHIVGDVVRLPDNQLFVAFDRLPPEGQTLQAWEVVGGVPQPLGTWQGHTFFTERPLASGSTFAISLEPSEGSPQPTGEPLVLIPL